MNTFWDEASKIDSLRAVIDINDAAGHKNAYIDVMTKVALGLHCRFDKSQHGLDFGCGMGRISLWLAERVGKVSACDGSAGMVERARSEAAKAGVSNVEFALYDQQTLPFNGPFGVVTCSYVLECIPDDELFTRALNEMTRVAGSGANLLFLERTSESTSEEPFNPELQVRRRPLAEYRQRFAAAGLQLQIARPVRSPAPICESSVLNKLVLKGLVPKLLYAPIARMDLALKQRRQQSHEWVDYLFVCRKPA